MFLAPPAQRIHPSAVTLTSLYMRTASRAPMAELGVPQRTESGTERNLGFLVSTSFLLLLVRHLLLEAMHLFLVASFAPRETSAFSKSACLALILSTSGILSTRQASLVCSLRFLGGKKNPSTDVLVRNIGERGRLR